jgi:hypothetical protein
MNFIKKAGEAVNSNVLNLEGSMSVWTVVWSLPQLGAGICPALPPVLWLRHDRSDPESVIVMFNDEVLWARRGDALQASRQPGSGSTYQHSDRFGSSVERINLGLAGHEAQLEISLPATKLSGGMGRMAAGSKLRYQLQLDGHALQPDREGIGRLPPPGSAAHALARHIEVPEFRQASVKTGSELEWNTETVVEYRISFEVEGVPAMSRWERYSAITCEYPNNAAPTEPPGTWCGRASIGAPLPVAHRHRLPGVCAAGRCTRTSARASRPRRTAPLCHSHPRRPGPCPPHPRGRRFCRTAGSASSSTTTVLLPYLPDSSQLLWRRRTRPPVMTASDCASQRGRVR